MIVIGDKEICKYGINWVTVIACKSDTTCYEPSSNFDRFPYLSVFHCCSFACCVGAQDFVESWQFSKFPFSAFEASVDQFCCWTMKMLNKKLLFE